MASVHSIFELILVLVVLVLHFFFVVACVFNFDAYFPRYFVFNSDLFWCHAALRVLFFPKPFTLAHRSYFVVRTCNVRDRDLNGYYPTHF